MTTAQDWINETKRLLFSGDREQLNRLTSNVSAGATSVAMDFGLGGVQAGSVIEIGTELMYVWEINATSRTATVQRGHLGTSAAAHTQGDVITINPRFPAFSILTALNDDLLDLSSPATGLYQVATTTATYTTGVIGYDLDAADYLDMLEVHYQADAQAKWWTLVANWRVIESPDGTDFPSGRAIVIQDAVPINGATLRLTYKKAFGTLAATTDDVSSTGLPIPAWDIPPLGAAARLVFPRAVKRNFDESQGEPRRATEVTPDGMLQAANALLAFRGRRIAAEAARLRAKWPTRLNN